MDVILVKTREKVEKERTLLSVPQPSPSHKNGLDNIFAECPPEENIPNPQKQPEQPVMQEKQASAEQQEQSSGDSGQIQTGDMEEIQIEEINLQEQP